VRRHTRTRLRRSPTRALIFVLVEPRTAIINTSQHNLRRADQSLGQSRMNRTPRSEAT
jgi:hypothetical protein